MIVFIFSSIFAFFSNSCVFSPNPFYFSPTFPIPSGSERVLYPGPENGENTMHLEKNTIVLEKKIQIINGYQPACQRCLSWAWFWPAVLASRYGTQPPRRWGLDLGADGSPEVCNWSVAHGVKNNL